MRRVLIMGAGGRDFHDFNVVYRDNAEVRVVAFTATQIPGIAGRRYPPALSGPLYPDGIPIMDESEIGDLIEEKNVDEVVFAYSDLSHADVMHKASQVISQGATFTILGPRATMLESRRPVLAVCAVRTGCGKSQTSRHLGKLLQEAGLRVGMIRHPMPYGALAAMTVQRFASLEDIDAAHPTIEEREEYEAPVKAGLVMWAGVDYARILSEAEEESDVIIWDGGNNDFPFVRPDLMVTLVDPLRAGHETGSFPGEVNLRMADVVVVNKVDTALPEDTESVIANVMAVNPSAMIVQTASPVQLEAGPDLAGRQVLVIEDGPTVTHGGMPYGAGTVAARAVGAVMVDPRPYAVGSIARTFEAYPHLGPVLPAMGYGAGQISELEQTIASVPCDAIITGTPIELGRIIATEQPIRHASYESADVGSPTLADVAELLLARIG